CCPECSQPTRDMVRLRNGAAQNRQVPKRPERNRCPHSRRDHNGSLWRAGALCDVFVRKTRQPSVQEMYRIYLILRRNLPTIMKQAGARDPYSARVFRDLVFAARAEQLALSDRN